MKRLAGLADFVYKDKAAACKQAAECHMDREHQTSLKVFTCINATGKLMQDCLNCVGTEKFPSYTPEPSI